MINFQIHITRGFATRDMTNSLVLLQKHCKNCPRPKKLHTSILIVADFRGAGFASTFAASSLAFLFSTSAVAHLSFVRVSSKALTIFLVSSELCDEAVSIKAISASILGAGVSDQAFSSSI